MKEQDTYTEKEFAKAFAEAYTRGFGDYYVVVNKDHFEWLIDHNALAIDELYNMQKASTGKPLFFAFKIDRV